MAANNVITAQQLGRAAVRFVQGTDAAGTPKSVYVANAANSGTLGSQVKGLYAVSSDATSAHAVTLLLANGSGTTELVTVSVPANSGNASGTPPVSLMAAAVWPGLPVDSNGNPFQNLQSGDTLMAQFATTLAASSTLAVIGNPNDF
jgi:hypothetical protein